MWAGEEGRREKGREMQQEGEGEAERNLETEIVMEKQKERERLSGEREVPQGYEKQMHDSGCMHD